jgi:hypothetical protein
MVLIFCEQYKWWSSFFLKVFFEAPGDFWALSYSREKHLLSWSLPAVRLSARLPLHGFSWNLILGTWKFVDKTQIWLKLGTLRGDISTFYCCRRRQIAIKALSLSEMVSGCLDTWGGVNITRTRHIIIHTLPVFLKFIDVFLYVEGLFAPYPVPQLEVQLFYQLLVTPSCIPS